MPGRAGRAALVVVLAAALVSCAREKTDELGSARASCVIGDEPDVAAVSRVEVYVAGTSAKGARVDVRAVAHPVMGTNRYEILFDKLPVGEGYAFSARAFDAAERILFQTANFMGYSVPAEQPTARITPGGFADVLLLLQAESSPAAWENAVPIITAVVASDAAIVPGARIGLKAYWSDPDREAAGETMTFQWDAGGRGTFSDVAAATTDWTAPAEEGDVVLAFYVDDGRGARTGFNFTVNVAAANATGGARVTALFNRWPRVARMIAENADTLTRAAELPPGTSTVVTASASDADGDPLVYEWTTTCGELKPALPPADNRKIFTAPEAGGACVVSVVARDLDAHGAWKGGRGAGQLVLFIGNTAAQSGPHLELATMSPFTPLVGEELWFEVRASTGDGQAISYAWTVDGVAVDPARVTTTPDGLTSRCTWTIPECASASPTATFTVAVTLDDAWAPWPLRYAFPPLTVACPQSARTTTFTTSEDFDRGALGSVEHAAAGQLTLTSFSATEPFIYVAQTEEGILLKVDTRTGKQLGRYETTRLADCPACPASRGQWMPSRTAVDLAGDVWVANRSFGVQGSVTKIASSVSGCVDRNANGVIDTSRDANGDGFIDKADPLEFLGQDDECLVRSIPVAGPDAVLRALALDAAGKLWVGGYNTRSAYQVDPVTGALLQTIPLGTTPYGFVVRGDYLYSAALGQPVARANITTGEVVRKSCPNNYGIAVDRSGIAWFGDTGGGLRRADFTAPGDCQWFPGDGHNGVAVDGDGQIWACSANANRLQKYASDGTLLGAAAMPAGISPYGAAIGHDGAVWTAGWHGLGRVEPGVVGGPPGAVTVYSTDYPGHGGIFNYTYSDMTGFQLRNVTVQQGSWTVVVDGAVADAAGGKVSWNAEPEGSTPAGTAILAEVRAANAATDLAAKAWSPVGNGVAFDAAVAKGRYLQVRFTLRGQEGVRPILSDATVTW